MNKTKIELTNHLWSPVTGCTPISEGCANCYAKRMAQRLRGRYGYPSDDPFRVTLHHNRLGDLLKLKKPRMIFTCSMGDLFHEDVPFEYIERVFSEIRSATFDDHIFQILTKRPKRMLDFWNWQTEKDSRPPNFIYSSTDNANIPNKNIWIGVTVENQQRADERIPLLMQIPAAVRFVSCEPMLLSVNLNLCHSCQIEPDKCDEHNKIDWIVCGGETGPGARPMHPDWIRSLRDQCQDAGTPFFFKSWGDWVSFEDTNIIMVDRIDVRKLPLCEFADGTKIRTHDFHFSDKTVYKVGKKKAGRMLDGKEHAGMPII